tara:strand:+ start:295 stop:822 length:528 start_codon:yes stop_codon:yes gene_type:complete
MKKIILLFTLILFTFNGYSQDKGYVGLGLGVAIPSGDATLKSGLGLNLIGAGYMFSEKIGATINWGASSHKSSESGFSDVTYGIGYFGIGPLFRFDAGKSMTIDLKPQYASTSLAYTVSGIDGSFSGSGFLVGSSFNFAKSKKWGFGIDVDYMTTTIEDAKINVFAIRGGIQYRF